MNNLMLKTVLGFSALLLVLGLMLFIPAGTVRFWQAWLYLAVFFGSCFLITLYLVNYDQRLLAARVDAGPTAEKEKGQQVIQSFASLIFIGLYLVAGLDFRYHWSAVPTLLVWVANLFVAVGFYIVFLVFRENSFTSATIEVASEQKVITSGPYRWVRHPMYLGALLMLLFTPLALGSWVALPFPFLMLLVLSTRLLAEEKFLLANLNGYAQYCQTVRYHLIPFLW